ncbi:MAG: hypothetical protein WC346_18385 [Methanogenium sp.]|jgi:hypothetical protein
MSKTQHKETEDKLQRQKKMHRKKLLNELKEEIDRLEIEQTDWEREMGFNNEQF